MSKQTYVVTFSGDNHLERANLCVRALKKFSSSDIVVLGSSFTGSVDHDQVVVVDPPSDLSLVEQSRYLKIGAFFHLDMKGQFCYLDTDVLAVSSHVDDIFGFYEPPITFGADFGKTVARFTKYAITRKSKRNLAENIAKRWVVKPDQDWKIWNGGMYLFDIDSVPFLGSWLAKTLWAMKHPDWHQRDQGTLIGAVWEMGLQEHPVFPPNFNWLHSLRGGIKNEDGKITGKMNNGKLEQVHFIHFPVSYGDPKSETWQNAMRIING